MTIQDLYMTDNNSLSNGTAERVLIVEDDPATRTGLAELVQNWGFQTDEAADGEEALRRVTSFRPAISLGGTETRVLVEQTTVVDPERLGRSAGRLGASELRAVDEALMLVLGL